MPSLSSDPGAQPPRARSELSRRLPRHCATRTPLSRERLSPGPCARAGWGLVITVPPPRRRSSRCRKSLQGQTFPA
eukprot:5063976-Alexandrium_andersonii.AAC.1